MRSAVKCLFSSTIFLFAVFISPSTSFGQASDIQPFQAEEVKPYNAERVRPSADPERARARRFRAGAATFAVPGGWMTRQDGNRMILMPMQSDRYCTITMMPSYRLDGTLERWFDATLPTLMSRDRVLEERPVQSVQASNGRRYLSKLVRVRSGGRGLVREYLVREVGGQAQVLAYEAEGVEEFKRHRDGFRELLASIEDEGSPRPNERRERRGREISREPEREEIRREPRQSATGNSFFFRTFGLAVPGVAYSYDNYATNTRTNVVAAGTLTKSAIRVNGDHTFEWNSAWDGKIIRGRWMEHSGGILLVNAQEGKDWLMQRIANPTGKAEITLSSGSVWYDGTPLN